MQWFTCDFDSTLVALAFQDDECFMMYELAEGPTETFQNIPCVLSHVKSTHSIGISLVSQQPLGHGYYWTWPRGHMPWGLILDLGPKVGEYEVHHLWIPRRWCTDALAIGVKIRMLLCCALSFFTLPDVHEDVYLCFKIHSMYNIYINICIFIVYHVGIGCDPCDYVLRQVRQLSIWLWLKHVQYV